MTASLKRQAAVRRSVEEEAGVSASPTALPVLRTEPASSLGHSAGIADAGIATHDAFTRHLKIIDAIFGGKL